VTNFNNNFVQDFGYVYVLALTNTCSGVAVSNLILTAGITTGGR